MPLEKQAIPISFAQGLDQKTDPWQVSPQKFLSLQNTVFTKDALLQKRNGFLELPALPADVDLVTTFNGNLTAIGTSIYAYSSGSSTWITKGNLQPLGLATLPLIRSQSSQTQCDSALASNGLVCVVYTDTPSSGTVYRYAVIDSTTGQNIIAPTNIPLASGAITAGTSPRVFVLANYFMIIFNNTITATEHLQYVAVNVNNPTIVSGNTNISSQITAGTTNAFDGVVANGNLYLAWNGSDGGGAIRALYIDSTLTIHGVVVVNSGADSVATLISVCADNSQSVPGIWITWYDLASTTGFTHALDGTLVTTLVRTAIIASGTYKNITTSATGMVLKFYGEKVAAYSYDSGLSNDIIETLTVTLAGVVSAFTTLVRGVGLASKVFTVGTTNYFLCVYTSTYQPTFFLSDQSGHIIAKLAYANAGGYITLALPSATVIDDEVQISYLIKDTIEPANKTQGSAETPIYASLGINAVTFTIGTSDISTAEIGKDLLLTGGLLWQYDGSALVEQNFNLWPDNIEITTATTTGHLTAQIYYYQVTYEWTDNQGNIYRSAPSIPTIKDLSGTGVSTNKNTLNIPTLRLTAKTANPVSIVVYRWSTAQQSYYKVGSSLNSTTTDSVAFVDTLADSSIVGNALLYTTGGVVENIGPPACSSVALFKSRFFLVDAEDKNLIWYSKQVIESTPVEMSDLFTIFVPPTTGEQASTGDITALSSMDDKLIIFKSDAIYYVSGTGPDNTGANNDFSDPVFITSTVGCSNQQSIVFMPEGLMFQSDKGIWLLGRNLSTSYIGAPVDDFALENTVTSAVTVPGTNQVRCTLSNNVILMYDYFAKQWGTFVGLSPISSTIYGGAQTIVDTYGRVFQENPGSYLDGASPTLISFTTAWINLAGLQGFERFYYFYLIGKYMSPHKISVGIAYDYNPTIVQSVLISPTNFAENYGDDPYYGSGVFAGPGQLEQWRVFPNQQKCQSFQLTITEVFDSTFDTVAGAGFSLSGLNLILGMKKRYPSLPSAQSAGG